MTTIQRRFVVPAIDDPRDRHDVPCARCDATESISLFANDHVMYWHCPACRFVWVARGEDVPPRQRRPEA